tara:strand:- start:41 stop:316 length:276 start_codon:yes stop_codon:yes gene_type:complete
MPEVKGKKFDYSVEGIKQAEALAEKTGEQIEYTFPGGLSNAMDRKVRFEGLHDGTSVPKELADLENQSIGDTIEAVIPPTGALPVIDEDNV